MIDIENEVVSRISAALHKGTYVTGEYVSAPAVFPHVSVVEMDNYTLKATQTQELTENHAVLTYEINIYSNLKNGKKAQCKALAAAADTAMQKMGFTRISLQPVQNILDGTIYRMTGRYTAAVATDKTIYRR